MNEISGARPQAQSLPPKTKVAGEGAAAPAERYVPTDADTRLLRDLRRDGFKFSQARSFYIPRLMSPREDVTATQFLEGLEANRAGMQLEVPGFAPVDFHVNDLPLLAALQSGGSTPAAVSLLALQKAGWLFVRNDVNVGPLGALQALEGEGSPLRAVSPQHDSRPLASIEDAARLRYFEVDGDSGGLSAPEGAAALKQLGDHALFIDGREAAPEAVYQSLYQQKNEGFEIGNDQVSLVSASAADLKSPPALLARLRDAEADYASVATRFNDDAPTVWPALQRPLDQEALGQRAEWMDRLLQATEKDASSAVDVFHALSKLDGAMGDNVARFAALRQASGDDAQALQALPFVNGFAAAGGLSAGDRVAAFVPLMNGLAADDAATTWKTLDAELPPADLAGGVRHFMSLADFDASARLELFADILAERRNGEPLDDLFAQFHSMARATTFDDEASAGACFKTLRHDLDATLPPPWTTSQRFEAFGKVLEPIGDPDEAMKAWRVISGSDGQTPAPSDAAELASRRDAFLRLYNQHGQVDDALVDYRTAARGRLPDESIANAVATLEALRDTVGSGNEAEAFEFARSGVLKTLPDTFSSEQKRALFQRWLTSVGDFDSAQEQWPHLTKLGDDCAASLDAAQALNDSNPFDDVDATLETLGKLRDIRAADESLLDVTRSYKQLCTQLSSDYEDDVLEAMRENRASKRAWPFPGSEHQLRDEMLTAAGGVDSGKELWTAIGGDKPGANFYERARAAIDLCPMHDSDVDDTVQAVNDLGGHLRPGETLSQASAKFRTLRNAVDSDSMDNEDLMADFLAIRDEYPPDREALLLRLYPRCGDLDETRTLFTTLEGLGTAAGLSARVDAVASWNDLEEATGRVEAVQAHMPAAVDVDRAAPALLSASWIADDDLAMADECLETLTPKASSSLTDRTTALESIGRLMGRCGDADEFDRAWHAMSPQTLDRVRLMDGLLRLTYDPPAEGEDPPAPEDQRSEAVEDGTRIMRHLETPEGMQAVAQFMSQVYDHADGARKGLITVLDAHADLGAPRASQATVIDAFARAWTSTPPDAREVSAGGSAITVGRTRISLR